MFYKIRILKKFIKFTGKNLCRSLLLIKLQASGLVTLIKRDPSRGFFLRILRNLQEHILCRTVWPTICWKEAKQMGGVKLLKNKYKIEKLRIKICFAWYRLLKEAHNFLSILFNFFLCQVFLYLIPRKYHEKRKAIFRL